MVAYRNAQTISCFDSMRLTGIAWFIFIFLFERTLGVYYIPERTEVTYVNEKYAYNASAYITRYGRKSTYYYNIQAGIKHSWGNNVTVHLVFFEYQHSQYKRSFVEIQLKTCDLLERDPYVGKFFHRILDSYNIPCPVPPGMYNFFNMTLPSENLPNILPFEKGKMEVTIQQLPSHDIMTTIYVSFIVKTK